MVIGLARLETRRHITERVIWRELEVGSMSNGTSQSYVSDALDVLRLGKHVQRSNIYQFKDTVGAQNVQVSRQRCRVARHIKHLGRTVFSERIQTGLRTTGS